MSSRSGSTGCEIWYAIELCDKNALLIDGTNFQTFAFFFSPSHCHTGMLAPMLVQMERQIDREIAADNKANCVANGTQTDAEKSTTGVGTETTEELFDSDSEEDVDIEPVMMYGPQPQIITNDLKSLDEMVSAK